VVDTFVPNDAHVIGGDGTRQYLAEDENDENTHRDWNSVILCTGANACGKVCCSFSVGRYIHFHVRAYT
jgi:DNA mismatch repair protein MSH5